LKKIFSSLIMVIAFVVLAFSVLAFGAGFDGNTITYDYGTGWGTAYFPDVYDFTLSGVKATSCGTTSTCANTAESTTAKMVFGSVALSGGSVTVSGISPYYTSTTSYFCNGTDSTAAATVTITRTSTSSITITGTGSDVINYFCIGK
jgi:hypothetical protein